MTNDQNGSRPWIVTEVSVSNMPPAGACKWWGLYHEIILRLEKTPERMALRVALPEGSGAEGAKAAIARFTKDRIGKGHLSMSATIENDHHILYVRRGPNWKKV